MWQGCFFCLSPGSRVCFFFLRHHTRPPPRHASSSQGVLRLHRVARAPVAVRLSVHRPSHPRGVPAADAAAVRRRGRAVPGVPRPVRQRPCQQAVEDVAVDQRRGPLLCCLVGARARRVLNTWLFAVLEMETLDERSRVVVVVSGAVLTAVLLSSVRAWCMVLRRVGGVQGAVTSMRVERWPRDLSWCRRRHGLLSRRRPVSAGGHGRGRRGDGGRRRRGVTGERRGGEGEGETSPSPPPLFFFVIGTSREGGEGRG